MSTPKLLLTSEVAALAVCVGWAWRLSVEAKQRDAETDARHAALFKDRESVEDIPREAMWRAIERERGE